MTISSARMRMAARLQRQFQTSLQISPCVKPLDQDLVNESKRPGTFLFLSPLQYHQFFWSSGRSGSRAWAMQQRKISRQQGSCCTPVRWQSFWYSSSPSRVANSATECMPSRCRSEMVAGPTPANCCNWRLSAILLLLRSNFATHFSLPVYCITACGPCTIGSCELSLSAYFRNRSLCGTPSHAYHCHQFCRQLRTENSWLYCTLEGYRNDI